MSDANQSGASTHGQDVPRNTFYYNACAGDPLSSPNVLATTVSQQAQPQDMMKEVEVRRIQEEEEQLQQSLSPQLQYIRKVVRQWRFNLFFSILITVDLTALIVVHTTVGTTAKLSGNNLMLSLLTVDTTLFAAEILMRAIAAGGRLVWVDIVDGIVLLLSSLYFVGLATDTMINTLWCRPLRFIRILHTFHFLHNLQNMLPLKHLMQAASSAATVLIFSTVLLSIMLFSFALLMAVQVPEVATEGGELRETVVELYGSIFTSIRTLIAILTGIGACREKDLMRIMMYARTGDLASSMLLVSHFATAFVLVLCCNGLVTGIFIEQLTNVESEDELRARKREELARTECLMLLDEVFCGMGFSGDDKITWPSISKAIASQPTLMERLEISAKDAEQLYTHLAEANEGGVATDEFVFGLFKLKSISKSIETLSMDYQQEKTIQQFVALQSNFQLQTTNVQSRLLALHTTLPSLKNGMENVIRDFQEVQRLEEDLRQATKLRKEVLVAGHEAEGGVSANHFNMEMLRSSYQLDKHLKDLEEEYSNFCREPEVEGGTSSQGVRIDQPGINSLADEIVRSIKDAVTEELEVAKAAAGVTD